MIRRTCGLRHHSLSVHSGELPIDADRFDTLSRSLLVSGTRRRALALALSGALDVFRLVYPDDVDEPA